jgi:general secretion pathway protein A
MYEPFFGLKEMPFSVLPDPRYAYPSMSHRLAEGKMRFAADYEEGLAVASGPVGSGKTTLANKLVAHWSQDSKKTVAFLPYAADRGRAAFLKGIMGGFGVDDVGRSYATNRKAFELFLIDQRKAGRHVVLVIDEGQDIYSENLDTIVDLTNFRTATAQFITVIIFAQDNFKNKLRTAGREAFNSRIAQYAHLDPLDPSDMHRMIAHRLTIGGASVPSPTDPDTLPDISSWITEDALVELYRITKGIPRDVCIFLNSLFLSAYLLHERPIRAATVLKTLSDLSNVKKWPVALEEKVK